MKLISNIRMRMPNPMKTHVSIGNPKNITTSSNSELVWSHSASDHVEIAHDLLRLTVPQKNFAISCPDPHAPFAPDVRAPIAEPANAVSAKHVPLTNRIVL